MNKDNWVVIAGAIYFALFSVSVAIFALWRIKRNRVRAPLEFKLVRAPGETLRRRMAAYDENLIFRLGGAAFVPVLAIAPVFWLMACLKPATWTQFYIYIGVTIVIFGIILGLAFRWAVRDFFRYRDDRLGYLGERAVGEALTPLYASNYVIFHDVPASAGGHAFNVDHVVIGTSGIFAIETKTRRKGKARPGFEAHKVAYDGKQLIWPWGEETSALENAESRARVLSAWINKMTGLGIAAKPILVLPGWYVVPQGLGPVTVVNHKQLCSAINRAPFGLLTREQIDLIARQLDERCRDVED